MTEVQMLTHVLTAVFSALLYGFIFYSKALDSGEDFDYTKILATLIISIFIGTIGYLNGIEINYDNFTLILSSYAGAVAITETFIKSVIKWYRRH